MASKYLSTTALSKEIKLPAKEVFKVLADGGLVKREEDNWVLTDKGKEKGGIVKSHPKFGNYIAWLEEFKNDPLFKPLEEDKSLLNATDLR